MIVFLTANGRADEGQEPALKALTESAAKPNAKLLLHLHGGLVDEAAGKGIAARLVKTAADGGLGLDGQAWTQVFVVWRTGALETLRENWLEILREERLYRALIRKLLEFAAKRLGAPADGRSLATIAPLTLDEITQRMLGAGDRQEPFLPLETAAETRTARGRGPRVLGETDAALAQQFVDELPIDEDFAPALVEIDAWANRLVEGRAPLPAEESPRYEAAYVRLNALIRNEIEAAARAEEATTGKRGLVAISTFVLEHAWKVAYRCFKRFRTHRDHGIHATIVEEVLREFYGDFIGATVWGAIKRDARQHFEPEGFGLTFLEALPADRPFKLVVTAHSAGSIWAAEMLKVIAKVRPNVTVHLVLLAPAVRHGLFADAVAAGKAQLGRVHMLTMSDEGERGDPVLGPDLGYLYPSSLLYLVSGAFEEDDKDKAYVDAPILGMQRFLEATWLETDEAANAKAIATLFVGDDARRIVYAPTEGVTMGDSHGAFDCEKLTLKTVNTFCNA